MRLKRLCFGLAALAWGGGAAADTAGDIETLEAAASAHVAAYYALDGERSKLSLQYRALVEQLTQRLKFGTAPKNPVLLKDLQQAQAALAAFGNTADPLATLSATLTDDAARANALARDTRTALAAPGADEAQLRPLATRIAAAGDTLNRALGQALEQRLKQAETLKTDEQDLASLSHAVEIGHLPESGSTDPTIAEMLAPPKLMDPAPAPETARPAAAEAGHWAIEFGLFPSQDDAAYVMARLSLRGTPSRFTSARDKHGMPVFKVITRGFPTRAAAEAAAADLRRHDLHPSGIVEAPGG
jgi:cell division septation protein DedD